MKSLISLAVGASVLAFAVVARGEIKIVVDHNSNESASVAFKFKNVPTPSKNDPATSARFTILDGERDDNGGDLDKLHDGKLPTEEDEPAENFFFNAGTESGRLRVDSGKLIEIKQVNTYSWHPNTRGPQVYKLYAADGKAEAFNAQPRNATDPEKCGWKLIAKVDTRPKQGAGGGQYGVIISDSDGIIGKYRYLFFDIGRTENDDPFGNTFYSEIDVIGNDSDAGAGAGASEPAFIVHSADGYCEISIDTSAAPNLKDWAENKLAPVLAEWYPKIVAMLPCKAYDQDIVKQLNAAMRQGKYHEELWKEHTGHSLHELTDEWKAGLEKQLAMPIKPKQQSS